MGVIWIVLGIIAALRMVFQDHGGSYGVSLALSCVCVTFLGGLLWLTTYMLDREFMSAFVVASDVFAVVFMLVVVRLFNVYEQFLYASILFAWPSMIGLAQLTNMSINEMPFGADLPIMTIVSIAITLLCWFNYKKFKDIAEGYEMALSQLDVPDYIIGKYEYSTWHEGSKRYKLSWTTVNEKMRSKWAHDAAGNMLAWKPVFGEEYIPWYDHQLHRCEPETYIAPPKPVPVEISSFVRTDVPEDSSSAFVRLT